MGDVTAEIEDQASIERRTTQIDWTSEMKVDLIIMDEEERANGRGFMKRVKARWDKKYPEFKDASWQKLRDNAARFKKESEIMNLILVRNREEQVSEMEEPPEQLCDDDQQPENEQPDTNDQTSLDAHIEEQEREEIHHIENALPELTEDERELETCFVTQLTSLNHSSMIQIVPREKLPKVKVENHLMDNANKVLSLYLTGTETIPEISDIVYAMGRTIGEKLGKLRDGSKENRRRTKPNEGNRTERKLKKEIKELRQRITKASNELHRRKIRRKATNKEKSIAKELRDLMQKEATSQNLLNAKEEWLDKLRYKKIKLLKYQEKQRRKMDNALFQRDQKVFFRSLEGSEAHEGDMPEMEKFVTFWGGIWERDDKTPNMPWMQEVKQQLNSKVVEQSIFTITLDKIKKEVSKRKGWTAPGIDGIQNFWWKKFTATHSALARAFTKMLHDNNCIPEWWPTGRTVLLPKTVSLVDEKNYRPITCLNTSYKIMTGVVAKYMRNHAMVNGIWDEGQLGAVEGVLGTVDQLIIDRCIMEEVKLYHRNLAVAFYDYKKAYDKVHHDWMLRVYQWIGIPQEVIKLLSRLMHLWKTRLEISNKGEKQISRWINISCGFLQGDSYSPVGFCLSEIPVCILLNQSKGYRMGPPGRRETSRTHSLFIDDLKVYQESHKMLRDVNEMIVQASHDTGACYGVSKCAEILFVRGKMTKGEGLQVLEDRMKSMDPDKNEIYAFLGIEQADGIRTKKVFERVRGEVKTRTSSLTKTQLNEVNLISAINIKVIPVAAYPMNVCKFTAGELNELDQVVKAELRSKGMHGRQSSDERLYLNREDGGRGLKSMRDAYKETRLRVACYMACSQNVWIKEAWLRETIKEESSIVEEAMKTMSDVGTNIEFNNGEIKIDGERIEQGWKATWKKVKQKLKEGTKEKRMEQYRLKEQQSRVYREQEKECHVWLKQNIMPTKTAAIMTMLEQMVETRAWKKSRGLIEDGRCRLCHQFSETVEHLLAGCSKLAGSEYLSRHNRVLLMLAIVWAKKFELVDRETIWYQQKWSRGTTLENAKAKLVWDFEFHLRKTTTERRPDLVLEDKEEKMIFICDMACPQTPNVQTKREEKLTKYRQLAYEMRERRPGFKVYVVPVVIGALGGGIKALKADLKKLFNDNELDETVALMQRTVLMDSESLIRRVISGLIQPEDDNI